MAHSRQADEKKRKEVDDDATETSPKKRDVKDGPVVEDGIVVKVEEEAGDPNTLENKLFEIEVFTSVHTVAGVSRWELLSGDVQRFQAPADAQETAGPCTIDVLFKAKRKPGTTPRVLFVAAVDDSISMRRPPRNELACEAVSQLRKSLIGRAQHYDENVEIYLGLTMWGHERFCVLLDKPVMVTGDLSEDEENAIETQISNAVKKLSGSHGGGGNCGMTNVSGGIAHAARYLAANNPSGEKGFDMTHIIMITDGGADKGVTTPDGIHDFVAKIRRDFGIDGVHTLPLTSHHDAEFCRKLAEGGNGLASFAPTASKLAEAIIEIATPLILGFGFFIVDDEFHGYYTQTRDYAITTITLPRGKVYSNETRVIRLNMLRGETSFKVPINIKFVPQNEVPVDQMPVELNEALQRKKATQEFNESMKVAARSCDGDIRKIAAAARNVHKNLTSRGFSAEAVTEVSRMASQYTQKEDDIFYQWLEDSDINMICDATMRSATNS